ncbi:MAG TPA: hypothetical protein VHS97_23080 [Isosphaeraceae bacterium]|nr:hypothetical protein [Isosphaeraceae bacterium]
MGASVDQTEARCARLLKAAELTGLRAQADGEGGVADERLEQPRLLVQAAQLFDQGRPQLHSRQAIGSTRAEVLDSFSVDHEDP